MGKRYYCEFCDKQFGDNPSSRKNHLTGVYHQRMRRLYYDSFKDPEVILTEVEKGICRAFQTTGQCNYGDRCHYTHMTNEYKAQLQQEIHKKREAEQKKRKHKSEFNPTLEGWLSKRGKKMKSEDSLHSIQAGDDSPQYTLPPSLLNVTNIPPSLLPPPPNTFTSLTIQEWG